MPSTKQAVAMASCSAPLFPIMLTDIIFVSTFLDVFGFIICSPCSYNPDVTNISFSDSIVIIDSSFFKIFIGLNGFLISIFLFSPIL